MYSMVEESGSDPYYLAARFKREEQAERAYFQLQRYVERLPGIQQNVDPLFFGKATNK